MLLKGKNIVITGSGRGIGKTIAKMCAKEGANVGLISRTEEQLNSTKKSILNEIKDAKVVTRVADVLKLDGLNTAFKVFHSQMGFFNAIIANAGTSGRWKSHEFDSERFSNILNVNVTGVFNTFKAGYRYLKMDDKKDKARFIITGSAAYPNAMPLFAAYTASKYGVVGLQSSLALEYKKEQINFNMILPMQVDTWLLRRDKAGDGNKPEGVMDPEDLNPYYLFLLTEGANRMDNELIYPSDFEQLKEKLKDYPQDVKSNWEALGPFLEKDASKLYDRVKKYKKLLDFLL